MTDIFAATVSVTGLPAVWYRFRRCRAGVVVHG
jgi:hypothetical protein